MIASSDVRSVEYSGPLLPSLRRLVWSVTVWARDQKLSQARVPAHATASSWFVTGLIGAGAEQDAWNSAAWLTRDTGETAAPLLRSEFELDLPVNEAYLVLAAGGYARVTLNGLLMEPSVLSPGFTDYDHRVQYTVSDVSTLMKPGRNAVSIELGRGFYAMQRWNAWEWHRAPWHGARCVRMLLVTRSRAGKISIFTTSNHGWKSIDGPTRADDLYAGEDFDARLNRGASGEVDYDDTGWTPAQSIGGPRGRLEHQRQPPIEHMESIEPVLVHELEVASAPGCSSRRRLFDVGRVIAGQIEITVAGNAGDVVEVTHGETLDDAEHPDVSDLNGYYAGRFQTHLLTLDDTELSWMPRFSYQGFRYIEVLSDHYPVLRVVPTHSSVQQTGKLECSDSLLNRIHTLTMRTILNNFHGIPTDTPTFEKNGWTGDGMLGAQMMLANFDTHELLAKWVDDVIDSRRGSPAPSIIAPIGGWSMDWAPAPPWHSVLVLVPWAIFEHTGDERVLRTAWTPIVEYLRFELARSPEGLATTTLGDWVGPDTDPGGGNPDEDVRVSATAFLAMMCATAVKIAVVLGEETAEWEEARERIGAAFLREFFDEGRGVVRGIGDDGFRQSHQVLALAADLIPPEDTDRVLISLVADVRSRSDHLNTGALATKWLLPVLTQHGHANVAFDIATQRTFPSWGFWVESGATSLWEHWHPDSRSRGHYFLGTIDDWLLRDVAGLEPAEPGWRRARIAPRCTHLLEHASAEVMTPYGRLAVSWHRTPSELRIVATVPVGVVAEVEVSGFSRSYGSGNHDILVPR